MGTGEEGVKGCVRFSAPGGGSHGDVEGFPNVGALTKLGHGRDAHATGSARREKCHAPGGEGVRGMLCGSPQKLATQPVVVPSSILTQVQRP